MRVVYVISSNDYTPISLGDKYLYQEYDKVTSFIKRNFDSAYHHILAKPVLENGAIQWLANTDDVLGRMGDLDADVQTALKKQYWELKKRLDDEVSALESSSNSERNKWGQILRQIFDDENNVILTNGSFWCLMWGWKFKNKKENYYAPAFAPSAPPVSPDPEESNFDQPEEEPFEEIFNVPPVPPTGGISTTQKWSFWYWLKRSLRLFVYRFWGLMLLILIVLFLWCLASKCQRSECEEIDMLSQELDSLNSAIDERCN